MSHNTPSLRNPDLNSDTLSAPGTKAAVTDSGVVTAVQQPEAKSNAAGTEQLHSAWGTKDSLVIAVGSTNRAKLSAVRMAVERLFHEAAARNAISYVTVDVPSGVGAQPMTADETRTGARNRALAAAEKVPNADFAVGLEGGIEETAGKLFECGYICVVECATKREGYGTSARFEISKKIVRMLTEREMELCEVMTELTGELDVGKRQGMMGLITRGVLPRDECYSHGVMFAFAPFVSSPSFWDE